MRDVNNGIQSADLMKMNVSGIGVVDLRFDMSEVAKD
jgi:hypothetical protein